MISRSYVISGPYNRQGYTNTSHSREDALVQEDVAPIRVGLLGAGTVGSQTARLLVEQKDELAARIGRPIELTGVACLDPSETDPFPWIDKSVVTTDTMSVATNADIVVELIGGTGVARKFVLAAIESGASVVTANKALLAKYGPEIYAAAEAKGVDIYFEASVGGAIPFLKPLRESLVGDKVTSMLGIVNGTTNFMLTKMVRENLGFDEALKIAQELGYAETKDPGDDVDGRDACRKIAILSSLVCGHQIYPQNIPTRGIRDITAGDVAAAEKLGCVIKLIAWMKRGEDGSVAAGVEPCLVPKVNQLAGVDDVFNAVLVKGDMLGDVVFYGKGAGKLPTASAVVADVVDALKNGSKVHDSLFWQPAEPVEGMLTDPAPAAYYVRVEGIAPAVAEAIYGKGHVVDEHFDGCAYFVDSADGKALAEAARKVEAVGGSVKLVLRRLPEEV